MIEICKFLKDISTRRYESVDFIVTICPVKFCSQISATYGEQAWRSGENSQSVTLGNPRDIGIQFIGFFFATKGFSSPGPLIFASQFKSRGLKKRPC